MFHPLLPNIAELKDLDLENKITELGRKYTFAARSGNGDLCSQILLVLEEYKAEQQRRLMERSKVSIKNQDKDLDDLINVNR
jgi:hypothetical protein